MDLLQWFTNFFDKKASATRANTFESQNLKSESQANN